MTEVVRAETVVVGAGPAGLAAASAVVERKRTVLVIDETSESGGQIWRRQPSPASLSLEQKLEGNLATFWPLTQVVGSPEAGKLLAERAEGSVLVAFQHLILAPGGRERFLPFPGWTLPAVFGAGGLELLARRGMPVVGKRIVVAGTGPLLLAAAAELRSLGAEIVAVVDQAPLSAQLRLLLAIARSQPAKLPQGIALKWQLRAAPQLLGWWVSRAFGSDHLESVEISDGQRSRRLDCDYLACGFHLVPNTEISALMGCHIEGGKTVVDQWQRTSQPFVYAVGETTGVGGAELALLEGRIAGLHATGAEAEAQGLLHRRSRALRFAAAMSKAFDLRPELRNLPNSDTIVCRCEDVVWSRLQNHTSWKRAKLQTRCGMGPCQGRICGPACEFLFGWGNSGSRPPLLPVRLSTLTSTDSEKQP